MAATFLRETPNTQHGERMTAQEIDDVLAEFDSNNDKSIDYKEVPSRYTPDLPPPPPHSF